MLKKICRQDEADTEIAAMLSWAAKVTGLQWKPTVSLNAQRLMHDIAPCPTIILLRTLGDPAVVQPGRDEGCGKGLFSFLFPSGKGMVLAMPWSWV